MFTSNRCSSAHLRWAQYRHSCIVQRCFQMAVSKEKSWSQMRGLCFHQEQHGVWGSKNMWPLTKKRINKWKAHLCEEFQLVSWIFNVQCVPFYTNLGRIVCATFFVEFFYNVVLCVLMHPHPILKEHFSTFIRNKHPVSTFFSPFLWLLVRLLSSLSKLWQFMSVLYLFLHFVNYTHERYHVFFCTALVSGFSINTFKFNPHYSHTFIRVKTSCCSASMGCLKLQPSLWSPGPSKAKSLSNFLTLIW